VIIPKDLSRKIVGAVAVVVASIGLQSAAHAVLITSDGQSFSVGFDGKIDLPPVTTVAGLDGRADFTLSSGIGTKELQFAIAVNNLSDSNLWDSSRISVLGFAVNPDAETASSTGVFNTVAFSTINPNGGIATDVCVKDGGGTSNCNGGGGGGVDMVSGVGTFTLTLGFTDVVDSLTMDTFGIRWQSLNTSSTNSLTITGGGVGYRQRDTRPGTFHPRAHGHRPDRGGCRAQSAQDRLIASVKGQYPLPRDEGEKSVVRTRIAGTRIIRPSPRGRPH